MIFRKAEKNEVQFVYSLYEEAKGREYCAWDEEYPTYELAYNDFEAGRLYVMEIDGDVAGALSVLSENEMDSLDCWRIKDGNVFEVGRIVVSLRHRGKGVAGKMVSEIIKLLKEEGGSAIHLSAASINHPAHRMYAKNSFEKVGEAELYGGFYYLLERDLSK